MHERVIYMVNSFQFTRSVRLSLVFPRPRRKQLVHLAAERLNGVMDREAVAHPIVDSAVAFLTALGPGLLESVYRRCLMYELGLGGLDVYAEYPIPIRYKETVLTSLKLSGHSIGFLLNWKVTRIKHGIRRMIRQNRQP
jgi:hypothetical protein